MYRKRMQANHRHMKSAAIRRILLLLIFMIHILTLMANNTTGTDTGTSVTVVAVSNEFLSKHTKEPKANRLHNKNATFLSILTDSSSTGGKLIAEVINHEVSAASYTVQVMSCSDNIPVKKVELEPAIEKSLPHISNLSTRMSHVDLTAPQRAQVFMIDLNFKTNGDNNRLRGKAKCLVSILNRFNKKLSTKLVEFSPDDSCICAASCACSCFKEDENLECRPVLDEKEVSDWLQTTNNSSTTTTITTKSSLNYHNDNDTFGIQIIDDTITQLDDAFKKLDGYSIRYLTIFLILMVLLVLLILGTLKGLFGTFCCFPVGRCGLSYFYDKPRQLKKYWEKRYSKYSVLHDSQGYPLDPLTRERTVQRLNPLKGLLLNVIFFLCCPLFFLYWIKDCCCRGRGQHKNSFDHLSREPQIAKSEHFGDDQRHGDSKNVESNLYSNLPMQNANYSKNKILGKNHNRMTGSEEEDESEANENFLPVFKHSEPTINERRYIAGVAQMYSYDADSVPVLTPIADSATYLQQLNRSTTSDQFSAETDEDGKRPRRQFGDNGNFNDGPCCRDHPYGSWHRAPAIFSDDYDDEDNRFDLNKTFELSRRRM